MQTYLDRNRRWPGLQRLFGSDRTRGKAMSDIYIVSQGYTSFTVGHASNSNTEQTFAYVATVK